MTTKRLLYGIAFNKFSTVIKTSHPSNEDLCQLDSLTCQTSDKPLWSYRIRRKHEYVVVGNMVALKEGSELIAGLAFHFEKKSKLVVSHISVVSTHKYEEAFEYLLVLIDLIAYTYGATKVNIKNVQEKNLLLWEDYGYIRYTNNKGIKGYHTIHKTYELHASSSTIH